MLKNRITALKSKYLLSSNTKKRSKADSNQSDNVFYYSTTKYDIGCVLIQDNWKILWK